MDESEQRKLCALMIILLPLLFVFAFRNSCFNTLDLLFLIAVCFMGIMMPLFWFMSMNIKKIKEL